MWPFTRVVVREDRYREDIGAAGDMKEDKASRVGFLPRLRGCGLDGVMLFVGDKCPGMLEAVDEVFPEAKYQRYVVHFYRNVFSVVPKSKVKLAAQTLKAIHAWERRETSHAKAQDVTAALREMKLKVAQNSRRFREGDADIHSFPI